jgi:DNA mismatch endonuclease (patch repair protein)
MDTFSKKKRSEIMRAIRGKETKFEIAFRKVLWAEGLRYRKNPKEYFGKPDLAIKKEKTVIFLDSCFWHGCSRHCRMPSTRREYWVSKIKRNKNRDLLVNRYYKRKGWRVIRIWEHQSREIKKIARKLSVLLLL